jgi:hypothetical protein
MDDRVIVAGVVVLIAVTLVFLLPQGNYLKVEDLNTMKAEIAQAYKGECNEGSWSVKFYPYKTPEMRIKEINKELSRITKLEPITFQSARGYILIGRIIYKCCMADIFTYVLLPAKRGWQWGTLEAKCKILYRKTCPWFPQTISEVLDKNG